MIRINLLPVREITRRIKAKKQISTFIAILVLVLCALGGYAFYQAGVIKERKSALADLNKRQQKYTKILREIKELEKQQKILETRISVIKKLKHSSSLTVHALDEIARITPAQRMWLTTFSQSGGSLTVAGMALDNRTIAKYMDDLKASEYINSVSLSSSALKGYAGRNLKAFSITCSIAVPAEEEKPQTQTN